MSPGLLGLAVLHSWPHLCWPLICVRLENRKEPGRSGRFLDGAEEALHRDIRGSQAATQLAASRKALSTPIGVVSLGT